MLLFWMIWTGSVDKGALLSGKSFLFFYYTNNFTEFSTPINVQFNLCKSLILFKPVGIQNNPFYRCSEALKKKSKTLANI